MVILAGESYLITDISRKVPTPLMLLTLQNIHWYIKADLANGFHQFGTHPKDWRYQVYCNDPREHYIDFACPFGKTNSTLEFCPPVALFAKSSRWLPGIRRE